MCDILWLWDSPGGLLNVREHPLTPELQGLSPDAGKSVRIALFGTEAVPACVIPSRLSEQIIPFW